MIFPMKKSPINQQVQLFTLPLCITESALCMETRQVGWTCRAGNGEIRRSARSTKEVQGIKEYDYSTSACLHSTVQHCKGCQLCGVNMLARCSPELTHLYFTAGGTSHQCNFPDPKSKLPQSVSSNISVMCYS